MYQRYTDCSTRINAVGSLHLPPDDSDMDESFLAVWGPGSRPYALRCGPQLDHILYIVQMEVFNVLADKQC